MDLRPPLLLAVGIVALAAACAPDHPGETSRAGDGPGQASTYSPGSGRAGPHAAAGALNPQPRSSNTSS
jgi:hypothetical protein